MVIASLFCREREAVRRVKEEANYIFKFSLDRTIASTYGGELLAIVPSWSDARTSKCVTSKIVAK